MTNTVQLHKTGFLRLPEVLQLYTVSRSTWYNGIKKGIFPKPVHLSERAVGWRVEDIQALIDSVSNKEVSS